MRVTEELDAMRVMGIPMVSAGAAPRIGAGAGHAAHQRLDHAGGAGRGMLAADVAMGISPAYFSTRCRPPGSGNLTLALSKSVVFGTLIALIGCHWGLRVKPDTQSLGEGHDGLGRHLDHHGHHRGCLVCRGLQERGL